MFFTDSWYLVLLYLLQPTPSPSRSSLVEDLWYIQCCYQSKVFAVHSEYSTHKNSRMLHCQLHTIYNSDHFDRRQLPDFERRVPLHFHLSPMHCSIQGIPFNAIVKRARFTELTWSQFTSGTSTVSQSLDQIDGDIECSETPNCHYLQYQSC